MQVAHANDHITHAVIGGKKAINFGISDDPAFFQILSSALYKDPMLAMVRETICNAWDAHIESGRTDQPISVTLDPDYLTIKDFGNGIPDAMIGPIYGVYGASTKKSDGRQTGGFGLGCKSPFSYTDHFEVTSCHGGTKTIYNMSKSSAEVNGKPSIVPIASFPTTESGITVKIPLNREKPNTRLFELIRQVVFNGDILALFNGDQLPVLGLDNSECGLVLISGHALHDLSISHFVKNVIYVRYGNVIYPVEDCEDYGNLYQKVHGLVDNYYNCRLVMQAPPDSLSITPSREALTNSEITVETIKALLSKFLAVFYKNQELVVRHKEIVTEFVDTAAKKEEHFHKKLPLNHWKVPGLPDFVNKRVLRTTDEFVLLEVLLRYSGRRGDLKAKIWFNYITRYMSHLAAQKKFDLGLYQTWLRTMRKNLKHVSSPNRPVQYKYGHKEMKIATHWWRKHILAPLVQSMIDLVPDFDRKKLYYIGTNVDYTDYKSRRLLQVCWVKMEHHTKNLLHLMTPTVVVSHSARQLVNRMGYVTPLEHGLTGTVLKNTYFSYEVSRKKGEAEEVIKALKSIPGIEVLDLTGRLPHEAEAYAERQAEIQKARADAAVGKAVHTPLIKKNKPGLVRFDYILDKERKRTDTQILTRTVDPVRITDPKFIVRVSTGVGKRFIGQYSSSRIMYAAAMLYGSEGAVTTMKNAYNRYLKNGAKDLNDYLLDKILVDVLNQPSLLEYSACDPRKMTSYLDSKLGWSTRGPAVRMVELLTEHPQLHHLIPGNAVLSEEDELRWEIWKEIVRNCPYGRKNELNAVKSKLEDIPLKKEIVEFLDKITVNKFLGLINIGELYLSLSEYQEDPDTTAEIVTFIQSILN